MEFLAQSAFFFNQHHMPLFLEDTYAGRSAFLVAGGPSVYDVKQSIGGAGRLIFGVNNSPKRVRPNLWACVDYPRRFLRSIWQDPLITKFVPDCYANDLIPSNSRGRNQLVCESPNTFFYVRGGEYSARDFLLSSSFYWGETAKGSAGRSVLLVALKVLFLIGIRRVFLLGVDFHMDGNRPYCFEQQRTPEMVNRNNETFAILKVKLEELKPHFESLGYMIYNCNPGSNLTVYPYKSIEDAIHDLDDEFDADLSHETTSGMYERGNNRNIEN